MSAALMPAAPNLATDFEQVVSIGYGKPSMPPPGWDGMKTFMDQFGVAELSEVSIGWRLAFCTSARDALSGSYKHKLIMFSCAFAADPARHGSVRAAAIPWSYGQAEVLRGGGAAAEPGCAW